MKFFALESTTVGLWHFEETTGSTHSDGSGNAYTLTDQANAPTRITTTDFGGGLSFDGTNDVTERNGGGANLEAASITVEVLIRKPSPHTGDVDAIAAYQPRGAAFDGRGWDLIALASGIVRFRTGPGTGSFDTLDDAVEFPLDRWVYLAVTHDGSFNRMYRCGNLVAGPTAASAISYAASPSAHADTYKTFVLGMLQANDAGPTYNNPGKYEIGDIRISNIAKSDSTIYNEQLTQQYCEVEPKPTGIPNFGAGQQLPFGAYQRYKSVRAAVAQYNNLVIGP